MLSSNIAFRDIFLGASLTSCHRPTSNHTPIVTSIQTNISKPSAFRLKRSWLLDPSFLPSVLPAWHSGDRSGDAARDMVAQVKAAQQASKVWLRKHRSPPSIYHNCYFIIRLFDCLEEGYYRRVNAACGTYACSGFICIYASERHTGSSKGR